MKFFDLLVEAKFRLNYKCAACGLKSAGTTQRTMLKCTTPAQLQEALEAQPFVAQNMPVGWSSYAGGFYCGCTK